MKSWLLKGFLVVASALPVLGDMAFASAIPFTWDPSQATPPLSGAGSAFTADTINATNYLHSVVQPNGSFAQELILKINSFQLNGQSVTAPGFNSSYGLYFAINATGQLGATTTYSTLNISLIADPGNNDGSLSSSTAGVFFSNTGPSGVADDFILGAGTLIAASMSINPITMVRSAHYVESFAPAPNETGFFSSISPVLEVFLTTPPAVFQALPQPDGGSILFVNGGIAQANFVPEPTSIVLLASGLLGLAWSVGIGFTGSSLLGTDQGGSAATGRAGIARTSRDEPAVPMIGAR
jgi:hypothetical protein